MEGQKVVAVLSSFLVDWKFCTKDSSSLSGGLIIAWNHNFVASDTCLFFARILLTIFFKMDERGSKVANCYGPYEDINFF